MFKRLWVPTQIPEVLQLLHINAFQPIEKPFDYLTMNNLQSQKVSIITQNFDFSQFRRFHSQFPDSRNFLNLEAGEHWQAEHVLLF